MNLLRWLSEMFHEGVPRRPRHRKMPKDLGLWASLLEQRLCLSGLTSYGKPSANWFSRLPSSASASAAPSGLSGASADDAHGVAGAETRQFLVRLTPAATALAGSPAGAQGLFESGAVDLRVTAGLGLPGQILVTTTERDTVRVIEALNSNPSVDYFEEDFSVGATTTVFPNEQSQSPLFARQWGLNNTGQSGGVADADIDAPEAWAITVGNLETVIAVVDSGVDYTHPDLYLSIWINQGELPPTVMTAFSSFDVDNDALITFRDLNDPASASIVTDINGTGYIDAGDLLEDPRWADGIDSDNNGFEDDLVGWNFDPDNDSQNDNKPFDEHRHGTHVAGILGGIGNNGQGIAGVNWQTSIMPLRFLDKDNKGDISDAVRAINYSTMMRSRDQHAANIRVSNNSWGSSGSFSQALFDAVAGNRDADILFAAAAGNGDILGQGVSNDNVPFYPANLDLQNVISVGASNARGELAPFSNFGLKSVDIAAPGLDIVSTEPGNSYISRSGTSMATPHVAGVAALVFDQFPDATAAEVRDAILAGAQTNVALDGLVAGSRSLNALGALTASTFAPTPQLVPVSDIATAGTTEVAITVTYTDDGTVDTSTFDVRDIAVTRPGFSEALLTPFSAVETIVDGKNAVVYRFEAPGGTWDATDNGEWTIRLREGEIRDNQSLYTAPRVLGKFRVAIVDANVIFVNTTVDTVDADPGDGVAGDADGNVSLRAAVMHANARAAATTIVIPDGVYTLTIPGQNEDAAATGDLDLTSTSGITVIGAGALSTIIEAQQLDRILDVAAGTTATIQGLTLQHGNADSGGGIRNAGILTVTAALVTDNSAEVQGGGISNDGVLNIADSSLERNRVTSRFFGFGGGGLYTQSATSIVNSSFIQNTSSAAGGGILAFETSLNLDHVTISGNLAEQGDGGGLLLQSVTNADLNSTTIISNSASKGSGGGLKHLSLGGTVTIGNSILAQNTSRRSADVEGVIVSAGTNLFGQRSETNANWRTLQAGVPDFDQIGTQQSPLAPGLDPLQRVDGVVQVAAPISGGPSANSGIVGVADLALQPGMRITYSTVELEPNNSRGQAMRLDDRGWSLDEDPNITNSTTIPHVTITGTGDGTFDYFSFTVSAPNTTAVFDIDNGSLTAGETFDTELFLIDSSDNLLASNDNAALDPGSSSGLDSRIAYTFAAPGYYTIAVGAYNSFHSSIGLTGSAPAVGKRYVLHVSVANHTQSDTTYEPTSAANTLIPTAGTENGETYLFSAVKGRELFDAPRTFAVGNRPSSVVLRDVTGDGFDDIVTANEGDDNVGVLAGNGDGTFQPAQYFEVGSDPVTVFVGDFTGDGFDDIATANEGSGDVSVLAGIGQGAFQPAQRINIPGIKPQSILVGDVTGDGLDDIITANGSNFSVSILAANGDGTFQTAQNFPAGNAPDSIALGDVTGDGLDDIVTADSFRDSISVLAANGDGTFQPAQNFSAGDAPDSIALGDVTGDGVDDIVTANMQSDDVSVLVSNGDGSFQAAQNLPAGDAPISVALGDVNDDGVDDIVTANKRSNDVSVLVGNGDGTFQPAQNFTAGYIPSAVVLGDVDGDGHGDIVTANSQSDNVRVLRGNGDGSFQTTQKLEAGSSPASVVVGDVSGDGIDDIVTANYLGGDVSVLVGNGDGTFQSEQNFETGGWNPASVTLSDVTGDGINDIITASKFSNDVRMLAGNGDGTFQPVQQFTVGGRPSSVVVGDVTGDGLVDIITANSFSDNVSILAANGDGTFQPAQNFPAGDSPDSIALGDVTGDGIVDIVTANSESDDVSVLAGFGRSVFLSGEQPRIPWFGTSGTLALNPAVFVDDGFGTVQDIEVFVDIQHTYDSDLDVFLISPSGTRVELFTDVGGSGDDFNATTFSDSATISVSSAVAPFRGRFRPEGTLDTLVGENSRGIWELEITDDANGDSGRLYGWGLALVTLFHPARHIPVGLGPTSVVLGDVTGDGIDDIVTANKRSNDVSVVVGNGDGTFQAAQNFKAGDGPSAVVVGDVNGDGRDDIVTANSSSDNVSVLVSKGNATFQDTLDFATGTKPTSIALADVTGDGIDDIVTAFSESNDVSVIAGDSLHLLGIIGNQIESLPFRKRPLLLAHVAGQTYWITSSDRPTEFTLWSYSPATGVGVRRMFMAHSEMDVPVALFSLDDAVAIRSRSGIRTFDSTTDELSDLGGGNGVFQSAQELATGIGPNSVVVGDVTGDGIDDVLTVNQFTDNVSMLAGNGDGTFQPALNFDVGAFPNSVVVGDVTGDGIDDVLTANKFSDNVSMLVGNGDGTFQPALNFAVGETPNSIALGDVTGDGIDDIITDGFTNMGHDNLNVLAGNGDGTFQSVQVFSVGGYVDSMILSDVTGDGIQDIVAEIFGDQVTVLVSNGDGTFQPEQNFAVGGSIASILVVDVTGDGIADIVTANASSNNVSVLVGTGDATFQSVRNFAVGETPVSVAVSDVTGDGIDDIVTANASSNNVSVLLGTGDATFQSARNFATGDAPTSVAVSDVTGDGIDDILTADLYTNTVSVLVGRSSVITGIRSEYITITARHDMLQVRSANTMEFQPFLMDGVESVAGTLSRDDYEIEQLSELKDKLLLRVRLTMTTSRPGELQLLLMDAPQFDQNGKVLPSAVENLTLDTSLRLVGGEDRQLFVHGDRIYLTAQIAGSGAGDELLVYDRINGLRLVGDLLPGSQSSQVRDFVAVGENLYFTALASRIDNQTQLPVLQRELFVLNPSNNQVRAVRAGQQVTGSVSLVGTTLLFNSPLASGSPDLLWAYDTAQDGVPSIGAFHPEYGSVSGRVFLDRNGDGRQDANEPGRAGVTIYADLNNNGRHESTEPFAVSRQDDQATPTDESGRFTFENLPAGTYQFRELLAAGFNQTSPLTISASSPVLTELYSDSSSTVGLPSVVGDNVVFVDPAAGTLIFQDGSNSPVSLVTLTSMLPDGAVIQSIGSSHSQNGSSIVLTVTLVGGDEVVLSADTSGRLTVVASTATPLITASPGQPLGNTTLADIEDFRNRGFDSLSTTGTNVGFFAETSTGPKRYYLGDGLKFAEFNHGQVILDGNNEVFVDRVVESTGVILTGDDLFLDKATLDARVGGNTGWQITTRAGDVIMPLTPFDRLYDVSVSGLSATFRASTSGAPDALYFTAAGGPVTLLADQGTAVPDTPPVTLAAPVSAAATSLTVDFGNRLPASGPFGIRVGTEVMQVTAVSGNVLTVVRGASGTTAVSHPAGEAMTLLFSGFGSVTDNVDSPSVSLAGENLVFVGRSGSSIGLYGQIDGQLRMLVDSTANFGGRTLIDLQIGHQALSGNRLVFRATFSDGSQSIYLAEIPAAPAATVTVRPRETVADVLFGASALSGSIQGVAFTDTNLNRVYDRGEPLNAGRVVFLDENRNGLLDSTERSTVTNADGEFRISNLPAETSYVLRQVLPEGLAATTLRNLAESTIRVSAAATVEVNAGSVTAGTEGESADGVVQGVVFRDVNGNGRQDNPVDEPGMANVVVYVDENGDGRLNGGERSDSTGTDGAYTIDLLPGIRQTVRVVLPNTTVKQTSPLGNTFTTTSLNTIDSPVEVVTGDFNGDGRDDIATTIDQASEVQFFLNNGSGGFTSGSRVEVAGGAGSLAVGRFSGPTGKDGLVVGHRTSNFVKVLLPQANGTSSVVDLVTPQSAAANGLGSAPYFVTTGDFNGDQQDDIAVVSQNALPHGGVVTIFRNDGNATFTREQTLTLPLASADFPTAITAGRVNPDTTVDLIVASSATQNITILSNTGNAGTGRFVIDQHLPLGGIGPTSVQLGDLDNDNDNEIVVTNLLSNNVSIFRNNGNSTFASAVLLPAGTGPAFVRLVDLDQNNSLDLAFTNSDAENRFGILRNRGDGTFLAAETSGLANFQNGTLAFSLAIGHFDDDNQDGIIDDADTPDVVVSNRFNETLNGVVGGLTVGLNSVVAGAQRVDLNPGQRTASGLNFGLQTINQLPVLPSIADPAPVNEDASEQTITVTGITTGGEIEALQVTVTSDNNNLIAPTRVFDAASGSLTIRYTPAPELSGTAVLTVTVRDPGANGLFETPQAGDDGIAAASFTVVVNAVNDLPTIDRPADVVISEDDMEQTVPLTGIVAGGGESQPLRVTVVNSNPALISNPVVTYTSPASTGNLTFTPIDDAWGTATLSFTVEDGGLDGDLNTLSDNGISQPASFLVTVTAVNDPPTLSPISHVVLPNTELTKTVLLSGIAAGGGEAQPLRITAVSDNPELIPDPVVGYQSADSAGQLQIVRQPDRLGTARITVTVEDGGLDGNPNTAGDNATVARVFTVTADTLVPPGFRLTETGGNTSVSESGTSDTFTVVLTAKPSGNVVLDVLGSDTGEVTAEPATLTFSETNWNVAQTVSVTGVDDDLDDGDQSSEMTVSVNALLSDDAFDLLPPQSVSVTTLNNDTAGFTVSPSVVTVNESGTTDTFTVALTAAPETSVTMTIDSSDVDEATVLPATLTFTPANWHVARPVVVTGVDDTAADGPLTSTITLTVNSHGSDAAFSAVSPKTVTVLTLDDETTSFRVSRSSISVSESGASETFTVVLTAQPASAVVLDLTVTGANAAEIDTTSLTFRPSDWSTPQPVTVTGIDDNIVDGSQESIITLSVNDAASADSFDSLGDQSVTVTTLDDDAAEFSLSRTSVTVSEDGTDTETFTVVLNAEPLSAVVLNVVANDPSEVTVNQTSLTFLPTDWSTPQPVIVSGVDDDLTDGAQQSTVTVSVDEAASDNAFDLLPDQTVAVSTTDDDVLSQMSGDVDGDDDFDANDGFLIQLVKLSGTDAQINQSKGTSLLTPEEIRSNVELPGKAGDIDGDGDFDANDAFLIQLVKLSGTDAQINQSKGTSSLTAAEIRANVGGFGSQATAASQSAPQQLPVSLAVSDITVQLPSSAPAVSSARRILFETSQSQYQLPVYATPPSTPVNADETQERDSVWEDFREWIDAI